MRFLSATMRRVRAGRCAAGLLAALSLSTPASAALFERPGTDLRAEARAAAAEGKQLAVFLSLPDCPGCREMERTVFPERATEATFARRYRSVRVDLADTERIVDTRGQTTLPADFARRLHAYATPSFAFFGKDGEFLYRHTGVLDPAGFRQLGDYVRRGEYENKPFVPKRSAAALPPLNADAPDQLAPRQPAFTLQDATGRTRQLAELRGRVVALAVGYTRCPDVCPTTLAELKAAIETLPAALRPRVQAVFVTLDPERDSAEIIGEYTAAFRPRGGLPILGLRGDRPQTDALIRELRLTAERQPSESMGYTLDHTAGVFLIDAQGRLRGLSPYGQPLAGLVQDLNTLAAAPSSPRNAGPLARH